MFDFQDFWKENDGKMIELVKARGVLQSVESEKRRKTGWLVGSRALLRVMRHKGDKVRLISLKQLWLPIMAGRRAPVHFVYKCSPLKRRFLDSG